VQNRFVIAKFVQAEGTQQSGINAYTNTNSTMHGAMPYTLQQSSLQIEVSGSNTELGTFDAEPCEYTFL
jgi:hypothetical protein